MANPTPHHPNFTPEMVSPKKSHRRAWKMFLGLLITVFLSVIAWIGVTGYLALRNITATNAGQKASFFQYSGDIPADQLTTEGAGRINILLLGVGGATHPGGWLADSIEVLSIDPIKKTMAILSLPRDLYISIPNGGRARINSVYANGVDYCNRVKTCDSHQDYAGELMKETVSSIIDLPINYFVRLDFQGFEKVVDSLGGVQVYVDKPLNDPLFPDARLKGYDPLYIPAGLQTFDGKKALKYARSRETTSDFDRARRQQQIISAVRQKALSANVLANPKKVTDLITILGEHVKTDIQPTEMTKIISLIEGLDSSKTTSKVIDTSADGPLQSANIQGADVLVPKLGFGNYSDLQDLAHSIFTEPYLSREDAKIDLEYPAGKEEAAKKLVKKLKAFGYDIVSNELLTSTNAKTIISVIKDKPYTISLLKKRLTATASKSKDSSAPGIDLVITIGTSYTFK